MNARTTSHIKSDIPVVKLAAIDNGYGDGEDEGDQGGDDHCGQWQ